MRMDKHVSDAYTRLYIMQSIQQENIDCSIYASYDERPG